MFLVFAAGTLFGFKRDDLDFTSLGFIIGVMLAFNAMGFCIILVDSWLKRGFLFFVEKRRRVLLYYVGLGILLFLLNYLLFVGLKWMADVDRLFYIRWSGIRLLLLVWLVEMVIIGLTATNNFYRHTIVLYKRNRSLEESSKLVQEYQELMVNFEQNPMMNNVWEKRGDAYVQFSFYDENIVGYSDIRLVGSLQNI